MFHQQLKFGEMDFSAAAHPITMLYVLLIKVGHKTQLFYQELLTLSHGYCARGIMMWEIQ